MAMSGGTILFCVVAGFFLLSYILGRMDEPPEGGGSGDSDGEMDSFAAAAMFASWD